MANLIVNNKNYELQDNARIIMTCQEAGVPFGCTEGQCGTCQIQIDQGYENLAELTPEEVEMGMDEKNRLACQCSIQTGTVQISY